MQRWKRKGYHSLLGFNIQLGKAILLGVVLHPVAGVNNRFTTYHKGISSAQDCLTNAFEREEGPYRRKVKFSECKIY